MTSIEQAPCTRVVRVQEGNRWIAYVARLTGEGVYMRQKGKRTEYGPVSWNVILLRGVQSAAQDLIAERPARRKRHVSRSLP